ncbi:hypothetical protein L0244_13400 [bacterium]|nr:hypothetical protein [bacterium]
MREPNDWRLAGQERFLKGVDLIWKRYRQPSDSWDHDHCSFCWAKFAEIDEPNSLREGYTTSDDYHWICQKCFEDFQDLFAWNVVLSAE